MTNRLMSHFVQCGKAKEVWDAIKSYLDVSDSNTWVVDLRVTNYMTSHSSLLDFIIPSSVKSVQVANGTLILISGVENVSLSPTLSMSSIILMPSLSNSPLFISKITKHLNCFVTFNSTHYVFQDNLTKMTVGIGKERGGLYYLEGVRELQFESDRVFQVAREMYDREKILLWHCQLDHPSFTYLEHLFPRLFRNILVSSLRCKLCIYAKNHCVPFKINLNKSSIPFTRVFIEVWSPFSTPSASGYK